ncbi:MAG: hypothetical protein K5920_00810 [Bacteroidales bacterium]|nr:hypothetical protein [Bacteroidales bacterium]
MTMPDQYEYIHMATNERLAEMLEEYLQALTTDNESFLEYMKKYPQGPAGHSSEMIREAARRLKAPVRERFNYEAFAV